MAINIGKPRSLEDVRTEIEEALAKHPEYPMGTSGMDEDWIAEITRHFAAQGCTLIPQGKAVIIIRRP